MRAEDRNLKQWFKTSYGSTYYIDQDTFQNRGDGKLQYQVIEVPAQGGPPSRTTLNELDCKTGKMKSPLSSWAEDANGEQTNILPGSKQDITVSPFSKLHETLKNYCQQYTPEATGPW